MSKNRLEQIKIWKENFLTILKNESLERLEDIIDSLDERLKNLRLKRDKLTRDETPYKLVTETINELILQSSIAEEIAQSQYGTHLTRKKRKLSGRNYVKQVMPDGKEMWIDDYDNSDKFKNDPVDKYKEFEKDLKEHPEKYPDNYIKPEEETESISQYGEEYDDVQRYISHLNGLEYRKEITTYLHTDFIKPDRPYKEVTVKSEIERAVSRRQEIIHEYRLKQNPNYEYDLNKLAEGKVVEDKRELCSCGSKAEYVVSYFGTRLKVCKDCKKEKGGQLFDFICDGCKQIKYAAKFAYLNKDNQPVCQSCK